jgi:hypothetical protein
VAALAFDALQQLPGEQLLALPGRGPRLREHPHAVAAVEHEDVVAGAAEQRRDAGVVQQRPRERERERDRDQAPQQQQQQVLGAQAAPLLLVRGEQELHRRPLPAPVTLPVQQVDDQRDGEQQRPNASADAGSSSTGYLRRFVRAVRAER